MTSFSLWTLFTPWSVAEDLFLESRTLVGCREVRSSQGLPVRVFYPARPRVSPYAKRTAWFRTGLLDYVDGYLGVFGPAVLGKWCRKGTWTFEILSAVLRLFSLFLPLLWARLPRCWDDLQPAESEEKLPLVVWSHGLTGCGDEHGAMATYFAASGIAVALVQHGDGSSSKVDITPSDEGPARVVYYQHPDMTPEGYDRELRQRGCERRALEIETARQDLLERDVAGLASVLDPARVVVGGFSFGAMTSSLVATLHPDKYCGVVCHDGWFHIHLESLGLNIDTPRQAHEQGLSIPSLFIGSGEFQTYKYLKEATERLQGKCTPRPEVHVLEHSQHWNFMDLVFWLPLSISRLLRLHQPGQLHAHDGYHWLLATTRDFVHRVTDQPKVPPCLARLPTE